MKKESDLMRQVKIFLWQRELTGEVIWFSRLNSVSVETVFGGWVKGCDKGTPDWLALVRGRNENILALFIECKSDTGKLRPSQKDFQSKYGSKEGMFIMVCRDIKEVEKWFDKYAKNFVDFI